MAFGSITAASANFTLSIPGVYSSVALVGFSVDDAFTTELVDVTETQVGVDGFGVAGLVWNAVPMMIRFLASSPSPVVFENWWMAQFQINDILPASAVITQRSVGRMYTCGYGVLQRPSIMADARRVLSPREFRISWLPQGAGQPAIAAAQIA